MLNHDISLLHFGFRSDVMKFELSPGIENVAHFCRHDAPALVPLKVVGGTKFLVCMHDPFIQDDRPLIALLHLLPKVVSHDIDLSLLQFFVSDELLGKDD